MSDVSVWPVFAEDPAVWVDEALGFVPEVYRGRMVVAEVSRAYLTAAWWLAEVQGAVAGAGADPLVPVVLPGLIEGLGLAGSVERVGLLAVVFGIREDGGYGFPVGTTWPWPVEWWSPSSSPAVNARRAVGLLERVVVELEGSEGDGFSGLGVVV